jgi:hypothetical protein
MVEDLAEEEEDGGSVSEEALPPGLTSAWEEEDCRGVAISSVESREYPPHYPIPPTVAPGLLLTPERRHIRELHHTVTPERLRGQYQESIPMLRK